MLQQRQTYESPLKGAVRLTGGFATNGASAPTSFYGKCVESVAHTGTGIWTVTLKPEFRGYDITHRGVTVCAATPGAYAGSMGAYDKSAGTIVVCNSTAGSLADIAAAAGNIIFFELELRAGGNIPEGVDNYDS